jgi:hypothetical protein
MDPGTVAATKAGGECCEAAASTIKHQVASVVVKQCEAHYNLEVVKKIVLEAIDRFDEKIPKRNS